MSILDFFRASRRKQSGTAQQAKERLQIIVAHEGGRRTSPDFLPRLKRELLDVVRKYVTVDADQVSVNLEHEGDYEVLELNITIPDGVAKVSNA